MDGPLVLSLETGREKRFLLLYSDIKGGKDRNFSGGAANEASKIFFSPPLNFLFLSWVLGDIFISRMELPEQIIALLCW